jgi:hypothetical protein
VLIHGESVWLSGLPGRNEAVGAPGVDMLSLPGLIEGAARPGIVVAPSARAGHNRGNGHVYSGARTTTTVIAVDCDAYDRAGLLSAPTVRALVRGAGGSEFVLRHVADHVVPALLTRMQHRRVEPLVRTYAMPAVRLTIGVRDGCIIHHPYISPKRRRHTTSRRWR